MKIENPTEADVRALTEGQRVRINGRTTYTVNGVLPYSISITGPRGGWANLVPSTCGGAVQVTTISKRDWIRQMEVL